VSLKVLPRCKIQSQTMSALGFNVPTGASSVRILSSGRYRAAPLAGCTYEPL
jgi:hypothetical protein